MLLRDKQTYTLCLLQDVPPRWNSTDLALHKLSRVSEIGTEAPLGCAQWDIVAHIKLVLKPFKDVTATLGNVIPVVSLPKKKVSGFQQNQTFVPEDPDG